MKRLLSYLVFLCKYYLFIVFILFYSDRVFALPDAELNQLSLAEILNLNVESVNFFITDKNKAPGSIWTITTKELQDKPITYIRDVFEYYTPGINIGFQKQTGPVIGTRGLNFDQSSKTLFMVDGQGLNQKSHFGYSTGLESPFLGDIAKIEVINGPGALLHGSGAINGFINMIPKNGKDYEGVNGQISYGLLEKLQKYEAGVGIDWKNERNLYLYGGVATAEGFHPKNSAEMGLQDGKFIKDQSWVPNDLVCMKLDEALRFAAYLRLKEFSLNAQIQRIVKSPDSPIEIDNHEQFRVDDRYSWQTFTALMAKYRKDFCNTNSLEFTVPVEFFDHGVMDNYNQGPKAGREMHAAGRGLYRQEFFDGKNKFVVGAGVGYRSFDPKKQWFESDKLEMQESMLGSWTEYEAYTEDLWNITDPLTVSLGGRVDGVKYGTFTDTLSADTVIVHDKMPSQSAFSPRIALAYELFPKTVVKTSYQEGFRWPDAAYFLYLGRLNYTFAAHGKETLPALEAEKMRSLEINATTQPVSTFGFTANLNLYMNITSNSLAWRAYNESNMDTARLALARNIENWNGYAGAFQNSPEDLKAMGFELGFRFNELKWIDLQLGYDFSRPFGMKPDPKTYVYLANSNDSSSTRWTQYPLHQIKGSCTFFVGPKLSMNITGLFESAANFSDESGNCLFLPIRHPIIV